MLKPNKAKAYDKQSQGLSQANPRIMPSQDLNQLMA